MTKLIEELKALDLAQELFPHGALVRHIQFSPNGKYLATSRWGIYALLDFEGMNLTDGFSLQLGPNGDGFLCGGKSYRPFHGVSSSFIVFD